MPDGNITKQCFTTTFSDYVVDKNQSGLSRIIKYTICQRVTSYSAIKNWTFVTSDEE